MPDLVSLLTNANTADVRYGTLEGREHIIVPAVMMTEGVHTGSGGPVFYPGEELGAVAVIANWNYSPVVVYHPELNGTPVSARDPMILNSRKVGILLNTKYGNGKQTTEAWMEVGRLNAIDPRVMEAINSKQMMEVSTGVYVDQEATPGEWNGTKYNAIARNHRADHFAILPDQKGACSIDKGAGLLRNQSFERLFRLDAQIRSAVAGLTLHSDLSFSNIRDALSLQLREKMGAKWDGWIEDVFPDYLVYSEGPKYYKLEYTIKDAKVALAKSMPVEVMRVTEYRVSGSLIGNQQKENDNMKTREELVSALISNGGWKADDKEYLTKMSDADFARIPAPVVNAKPAVPDDEIDPKTGKKKVPPVTNNSETVVVNSGVPAPQDMEAYLAAMPAPMRALVANSLKMAEAEKTRLISVIVANKNNSFTSEFLQSLELDVLTGMSRLSAPPADATIIANNGGSYSGPILNYAGAAAGAIPINNAAPSTETPFLPPSYKAPAPAK